MNTMIAARDLWDLVDKSELPDEHPEYGKDHLKYMLDRLMEGEVFGEKAHRWIGWVQGCICMGKGASLEELKWINKSA